MQVLMPTENLKIHITSYYSIFVHNNTISHVWLQRDITGHLPAYERMPRSNSNGFIYVYKVSTAKPKTIENSKAYCQYHIAQRNYSI